LLELRTLATELKEVTESVSRAPAKLDEEMAALRVELRDLESRLSKTRHKRKEVEGRSAELAAQRQKVRQIYLFVGRVEQALENVAASRNVELLQAAVKALSDRITTLRQDLDPALQRDRLGAAIDSVSSRIAHYAQLLRLEHARENVRLNIRELTLQFTPLSGRTDFLWEVGSGQNWVGYHIAGLLALHEHFLTVRHNPVPRFLVIDQPSQVYFPEGWPAAERRVGREKPEDSPDIQGVRRIFETLSRFLNAVRHEFQIIVTEHAGPITWGGIADVHVVGNWRENQDDFLIPKAWQAPPA
jgi:phage shock protein A